MPTRAYFPLPINAEEGFPQAFRISFGGRTYQLHLYVNIAEAALDGAGPLLELPMPGAFLVMRVAREGAEGPTTIFRRKIIPRLEYTAGELAFSFSRVLVARQNLNGVGSFGSEVRGGIAAR